MWLAPLLQYFFHYDACLQTLMVNTKRKFIFRKSFLCVYNARKFQAEKNIAALRQKAAALARVADFSNSVERNA